MTVTLDPFPLALGAAWGCANDVGQHFDTQIVQPIRALAGKTIDKGAISTAQIHDAEAFMDSLSHVMNNAGWGCNLISQFRCSKRLPRSTSRISPILGTQQWTGRRGAVGRTPMARRNVRDDGHRHNAFVE